MGIRRRENSSRRTLAPVVAVGSAAALLVGIGGVAMAKVPDKDNGTVHLCYNGVQARHKDGGANLRIYDSDKNSRACKKHDSTLTLATRADLASGSSSLPSSSVTTPATFTDIPGYAITLPSAGTYEILASVRGRVQQTGSPVAIHCYVVTQFATAAGAVPGSLTGAAMMDVGNPAAGDGVTTQAPMMALLTVTGPTVVTVQHKTAGTDCSGATANVFSDTTGTSTISFIKIAG